MPASDRAAVAQLNYQLISQDAQVHRSIAQRLITEMLQRLAMHIVAGHAIQVGAGPLKVFVGFANEWATTGEHRDATAICRGSTALTRQQCTCRC
jgi:hypothetical protein